ncbi:MAG: type II and III secretion system protein [Bdellovibrio sp.]|nr:type II and III secretion system protein [Bdellovibrio sp.]
MKALLLFLFLQVSVTVFASSSEVLLLLGQSKDLPLRGRGSVWVQDRAILKAEVLGSSLSIKALQEGVTTIRVGDNLYRVQVLHPGKQEAYVGLKKSLSTIIGLNAEVAEGDLLVTGRLYRLSDWQRLSQLLKDSGITYQMRATLSQSLQDEAQKYFTDLISEARLAPQTVIFAPAPEIRVAGTDIVFKKYLKLLSSYGIAVLKDESSIEIAPTVKVQITVAEIKRNSTLNYGVKWPESFSASLVDGKNWKFKDAEFFASAIEANGWGKVLASPNIVCRSGKEAEFLAGGEIPIKIINYEVQDIVWKRYGILLRVRPKADASGRISLSIETEVSTIDKANAVDNIPAILTNRVSSHFDLTRPQTIALSGLLKNEESKNSSGVPLLSRLPILGALFSSKDFAENRSELVIFVRPSIMKEGDEGASLEHIGSIRK